MANFKITINGDERIITKFNAIDAYLGRLKKPLSKIGDILLEAYDDNFSTEGKTLRKPWKKLKAATIRQKAMMGFSGKGILERTGKLRKGFKKKVSRFKVRVFNPVKYFKFHQLGTPKLPKRVMITATENLKQDIIEIIRKPLHRIIER